MVCATHDPARELSVWELPSTEHVHAEGDLEGDKGFVRKYSNQWAEGWKVLLTLHRLA